MVREVDEVFSFGARLGFGGGAGGWACVRRHSVLGVAAALLCGM